MYRCFSLMCFAIVLPLQILSAQVPTAKVDWYRIYDGPGNGVDMTSDVMLDGAGDVYLAGRSAGPDSSQDLLLLKYSGQGDLLLELRYTSAVHSWDEASSIAIDSDSSIYIIGTATFEQNTPYAVFQKYSAAGTLLWGRDFNSDSSINSEGKQVLLNTLGHVIIGYDRAAATVGKYSASGDSLWTISFRDDTSSYGLGYLITDADDNIYAMLLQSYWDGGDLPATRTILVKISDSCAILWRTEINGGGARKMVCDKEGNLIIVTQDARISKVDPDGSIFWTKEYSETGDIVIITDLAVDANNDIVFTGFGLGDDSWDYFTQKLSAAGQDEWMRTFNSDEHLNDHAMSLALDKEDNIYVTGSTHNSISIGVCYTLKYSSAGILQWRVRFDAPHSKFELGNHILVDDSNHVFVGGDVADSVNGWNFFALKIKQESSLGIKPVAGGTPIDYSLSQNYPNPFNPSTTIRYALPRRMHVRLTVFNMLGQEVVTLVNGEVETGYHEVVFRASGLASGVYFYRLQAGEFTQVRKLCLRR